MPEGELSLTFYANDSINHIGFTSVVIIKDITDPVISINAPLMNQEFDERSLGYDISIDEQYGITSMWYTLDGGTTNTFFTELIGIIDESVWRDLPNGILTLRFYAEDLAGNIGYKDVVIFKDIEVEVEDTTAPIIVINAPLMNQEFTGNTLAYDILINEPTDSMWYTLDGGINVFPITEITGLIDEAAWMDCPNGYVTIRFYAEDLSDNVGYKDVIVVKNVEVEVEDTMAPIITINAPLMNQEFGVDSIGFDISINEPIDSMWYTIDGGITNFTFTELVGIIDETAWATTPKGLLIIRFYAKDLAGNTGYKDVVVVKTVGGSGKDNSVKRTLAEQLFLNNPLILVIGVISITSGISFVILKKKKERTL